MRDGSARTLSLHRFQTLLAALRDGPLDRAALFARLDDAYPSGSSRRPMVDRDVRDLHALGIEIDISRTRPPIYTLRGGAPVLRDEEVRALALIRDTFGPRHPQAAPVRALVERLAEGLTAEERARYDRRQTTRVPLDPAIDYTPYTELITTLESAISRRWILGFSYQPTGKPTPTHHPHIEPHEIEYHDRHFYLVAYTSLTRQVLEFRIDRIQGTPQIVNRLPPGMEHSRTPIIFRYRLAAALARAEISQRFDDQRIVERLPNGDVVIEATGWNAFFIVRTLLRYAGSAELLEPAWLREQMVEDVEQMYRLYKR
jgi:predicted DNA-binding transcriptional regulator YafY